MRREDHSQAERRQALLRIQDAEDDQHLVPRDLTRWDVLAVVIVVVFVLAILVGLKLAHG